ncbi:MAG TPA: hypothetical protein VLZ55_02945 [Rhodanobacter sp.]|jgi:hypothetical protein|nr:hypothetical protein [Rhodanobacter sp.]
MTDRFLSRMVVATLATVFACAVAGCYESPSVTVTAHEPGHYKGKVDPLLAKLKGPELQKQLQTRQAVAAADR